MKVLDDFDIALFPEENPITELLAAIALNLSGLGFLIYSFKSDLYGFKNGRRIRYNRKFSRGATSNNRHRTPVRLQSKYSGSKKGFNHKKKLRMNQRK